MSYSLSDFGESLRPGDCRIQNTPDFIFLCGGKVARGRGNKPARGKYLSARDFFLRHLKIEHPDIAGRVQLAEEVNSWFRHSLFSDLLELETYLAGLSDLTVLFVESPGSIAELGAFSVSDILRPKTLVIINSDDDDEASFISDGPIRRLKNENKDLVHYYQWNRHLNSPASIDALTAMAQYLVRTLQMRNQTRTQEIIIEAGNHSHHLLLISDILRIAGVATPTDIEGFLGAINYTVARKELKRYLSLLQSIGFITQRPYGEQQFYLGGTDSRPYVRYAFKADAKFKDVNRVRRTIRDCLDPVRQRILRDALTGGMPHA